ncbi:hypothetical protein WICMUC_002173 [Wickerhamomyces mucosus]|uniref:FAM192A/Fyv6 N-terminal domain-containing protein n=1 Tax=Wickerhamomyces mucosus TaxID=1378264 RepID=A0A9P8PQ44_9ASCO|nr:hypothetical protein WICMUC_002173 [Wickerhamomyces mucosus]
MSRFVPAGKSDLDALQEQESRVSKKHQEDEEDKEIPSLYEQMRLNHERKELEYQAKLKAKNQPHKINAKELDFYKQLRERNDLKNLETKQEIEKELLLFDKLKKENSSIKNSTKPLPYVPNINRGKVRKPSSLGVKKKPLKKGESKFSKLEDTTKNNTEPKAKPLLNNYSSDSESNSD